MKLILALLFLSCAALVQNDQDVSSVPFIKILSTECSEDFQFIFMDEIQKIRNKHACKDLKFDKKLANYSRNVAISYAQNGWVGGVDLLKSVGLPQQWNLNNYGELSRRVPANESLEDDFGIDPEELAHFWYGNGDLEPASGYEWYGEEPTREQAARFGYYTQLIWRTTNRIGFSCVVALNQSDSTKHYHFVANFNTPAYSECKFRQNVIPPRNKSNPLWEELRYHPDSLQPTEECQKLRIGMNYCPFGFEDELLSYINEMREKAYTAELKISVPLRKYSQNYANWLATQPENIFGNQPLSKYGGNAEKVFYYPDSPESNHSALLRDAFTHYSWIRRQQNEYEILDGFGKEPSDSVKEQCKDFTRAIWARSKEVGIGCALQWLPESNQSRSIVILNFRPPGNVNGTYADNVRTSDPED